MVMLAVDQSTQQGSAALFNGTECIAETRWNARGRDSLGLFMAVPALLKQQGIAVPDIDRYTIGLGPGSFTGIRITIAFIGGLALPGGKPVYGLGSAAAIALDAPYAGPADDSGTAGPPDIAVLGDARRNRFWIARFSSRDHCRVPVHGVELLAAAEAAGALAGIGCICSPEPERVSAMLNAHLPEGPPLHPACPSAQALGRVARYRQAAAMPSLDLIPVYLHPAVAPTPP